MRTSYGLSRPATTPTACPSCGAPIAADGICRACGFSIWHSGPDIAAWPVPGGAAGAALPDGRTDPALATVGGASEAAADGAVDSAVDSSADAAQARPAWIGWAPSAPSEPGAPAAVAPPTGPAASGLTPISAPSFPAGWIVAPRPAPRRTVSIGPAPAGALASSGGTRTLAGRGQPHLAPHAQSRSILDGVVRGGGTPSDASAPAWSAPVGSSPALAASAPSGPSAAASLPSWLGPASRAAVPPWVATLPTSAPGSPAVSRQRRRFRIRSVVVIIALVIFFAARAGLDGCSPSMTQGNNGAQPAATLAYDAAPGETTAERNTWQSSCRRVSLAGLGHEMSSLQGRRVRLQGLVVGVYDAGADRYYEGFPNVEPSAYVLLSTTVEVPNMPDQVVVVFADEPKGVFDSDDVTVWGLCLGRTRFQLYGGGVKALPVVEARFVTVHRG